MYYLKINVYLTSWSINKDKYPAHLCRNSCLYTYIRTYIHAYIHAYIHTYMHTNKHTCTHIFIYVHVHKCMDVCCNMSNIHVFSYMYVSWHTYLHMYICDSTYRDKACILYIYIILYVYMCIYIHVNIFISIYIYICIYMFVQLVCLGRLRPHLMISFSFEGLRGAGTDRVAWHCHKRKVVGKFHMWMFKRESRTFPEGDGINRFTWTYCIVNSPPVRASTPINTVILFFQPERISRWYHHITQMSKGLMPMIGRQLWWKLRKPQKLLCCTARVPESAVHQTHKTSLNMFELFF